MRIRIIFFVLLITSATGQITLAQDPDSQETGRSFINTPTDTLGADNAEEHSPGKASLYSAVVPGLGQAYNGKHWKIPIIYGGFIIFGYLIYDNNIKYQYFRRNLMAEIDENPETENTTGRDEENLRANRDQFRRYRDLNMILLGVMYLLQIADAHIDAHLLEFKLNPDITVSVDPVLVPYGNPNPAAVTGVSLKLRF